MALQGDLQSFALPDVLRLLAGTAKSGRLEVDGAVGGGELVFRAGTIATGAVPQAPHATEPGDVVFEILRFDGGAFRFTEVDDDGAEGDGTSVEDAIAHAEHLVAEWAEVEAVVPAMTAWIEMAPELENDSVEVSAEAWKALAFVAGGTRVRDLGEATEQSDLDACRQVKAMVEQGLLVVRPDHVEMPRDTYRGPVVELDSFEQYETPAASPVADLDGYGEEDRPVVLEEREDALLPEPLPGEGVAYEGELLEGSVDGHGFDAAVEEPVIEAVAEEEPIIEDDPVFDDELVAEEGSDDEPVAEDGSDDEPVAEDGSDEEPAAELVEAAEPEAPVAEEAGDAAPFVEALDEAADLDDETSPDLGPVDDVEVDDERGSLLRFLSTVKP